MTLQIRLFGAFRDCEPDAGLKVEGLPVDATIAQLRARLQDDLAQRWSARHLGLMQHSVFASESRVLREHEVLPSHGELALLPPVSGG